MQRRFTITQPILAAAIVATIFCSCYKPTPFVLPQQPYQFPDISVISKFLGTANAKIAFALTNNGSSNIYYVDFNDSAPVPIMLIRPTGYPSANADKPMISPDGTFVAYGLLQSNTVDGAYIQKLGTTAEPVLVAAKGTRPHWYKDSAGLLYIIYSTAFFIQTPTMPAPGFAVTYKQQVSLAGSGSRVGSAVQIAPYPMIGGLSSDGNYLCSGYEAGCFYNLPDSTLIPINQGVQICNPSIDPDSETTDQMMFLNFNSVQNLNNPYSSDPAYPANSQGVLPMHSVLFIVDASNTVINFIPISIMANYGTYSAWQCPQWSNNPNFAAALAASNDESSSWDLVLIKNVGSRGKEIPLIMTIGSGKMNTESTPDLWIGN